MPVALILFIGIPIIEMVILIEVGGIIGALPTVGLVVLTATVGIWLLKLEGMATLARVQERVDRGELPETELLEGVMLLIGGALLLTPGFVTDAIGFTCILPGLRRPIARWIIRRGMMSAMSSISGRGGSVHFTYQQTRSRAGPKDVGPKPGGPGNRTIEGDYSDKSQDNNSSSSEEDRKP